MSAPAAYRRTSIEQVHEDLALSERVRTLTPRGGLRRDALVLTSVRRARHYGYLRSLAWYWDHYFKPAEVDVR